MLEIFNMIYDTLAKRSIYTQSGQFSFLLNLLIDNMTGIANFGFSGTSGAKLINFTCRSGKFIDNKNNYVESYRDDVFTIVSGNISPNSIDYYINNNPMAFGSNRITGNIDYFYIDPLDCTATFDLYINGDKPNYTITKSVSFNTGQFNVPITITNNSLPFKIFSGIYQGDTNRANISGVPGNVPTGTSIFYINQNGLSGAVTFPFQLQTNFGPQSFLISGQGN